MDDDDDDDIIFGVDWAAVEGQAAVRKHLRNQKCHCVHSRWRALRLQHAQDTRASTSITNDDGRAHSRHQQLLRLLPKPLSHPGATLHCRAQNHSSQRSDTMAPAVGHHSSQRLDTTASARTSARSSRSRSALCSTTSLHVQPS
jgi:hypothetical protein